MNGSVQNDDWSTLAGYRSLVRRAAFRPEGDGAGLEEFCRIYWYPLYVAARRKGQSLPWALLREQRALTRSGGSAEPLLGASPAMREIADSLLDCLVSHGRPMATA